MPGMIGFETFRRFVTRIDYGASTITLIEPEAFDPKDAGTPVPITFDGNTIEVAGDAMNGIPGTFTIDTGSRAVAHAEHALRRRQAHSRARHQERGDAVTGWGVGGPTRFDPTRGEALVIGGSERAWPAGRARDRQGRRVRRRRHRGQYRRRRAQALRRHVRLRAHHDVPEADRRHRSPISTPSTAAGMWFNEDGEGYQGRRRDRRGRRQRRQASRQATIITAVDGKPAKSIPLYEMRRRLRNEAPGTVVTFAVKGKGEVKVTLRDLI